MTAKSKSSIATSSAAAASTVTTNAPSKKGNLLPGVAASPNPQKVTIATTTTEEKVPPTASLSFKEQEDKIGHSLSASLSSIMLQHAPPKQQTNSASHAAEKTKSFSACFAAAAHRQGDVLGPSDAATASNDALSAASPSKSVLFSSGDFLMTAPNDAKEAAVVDDDAFPSLLSAAVSGEFYLPSGATKKAASVVAAVAKSSEEEASMVASHLSPSLPAADVVAEGDETWRVVGYSPRKSSLSLNAFRKEEGGDAQAAVSNASTASALPSDAKCRSRAASVLEPGSFLSSSSPGLWQNTAEPLGLKIGGSGSLAGTVWCTEPLAFGATNSSAVFGDDFVASEKQHSAASSSYFSRASNVSFYSGDALAAADFVANGASHKVPFRNRSKSQSFAFFPSGAAVAASSLNVLPSGVEEAANGDGLFNIPISFENYAAPPPSSAFKASAASHVSQSSQCHSAAASSPVKNTPFAASPPLGDAVNYAAIASAVAGNGPSTLASRLAAGGSTAADESLMYNSDFLSKNYASFNRIAEDIEAMSLSKCQSHLFEDHSHDHHGTDAFLLMDESAVGIGGVMGNHVMGGGGVRHGSKNTSPFQLNSYKGQLFLVEFKSGRTEIFYVQEVNGHPEFGVALSNYIIVEADRGEDLGKVVGEISIDRLKAIMNASPVDNLSLTQSEIYCGIGVKEIVPKRIHRLARPADVRLLQTKAQEEAIAMLRCQSKVRQKKLPMEVVDAEYQWDRNKLTFYFLADRRIDFRELVRDLFRIYKTRIWMCAVDKNRMKLLQTEHPTACLSAATAQSILNSTYDD